MKSRCEKLEREKAELRRELEIDSNVRVMELQAIVRQLETRLEQSNQEASSEVIEVSSISYFRLYT